MPKNKPSNRTITGGFQTITTGQTGPVNPKIKTLTGSTEVLHGTTGTTIAQAPQSKSILGVNTDDQLLS